MDWDKLRHFYYVAKMGSVTLAATHLNLSQSALSRSILSLEEGLKVKLFDRHGRGILLTKEGEILFEHTKVIFAQAKTAEMRIQEEQSEAHGSLRIAANMGFASLYLSPSLPKFLQQYPNINLILYASDVAPDLDLHEVDALLHPPLPPIASLNQTYIMTSQLKFYASPLYLEKYGLPEKPEDLDHHRLIAVGEYPHYPLGYSDWHLMVGMPSGKRRQAYIQTNLSATRCALAEAGFGITVLSETHPGLNKTSLVEVLPHIPCPKVDIYYIYRNYLEHVKEFELLEIS